MHATPKPAAASTIAIDAVNEIFERAFADADIRILECTSTMRRRRR